MTCFGNRIGADVTSYDEVILDWGGILIQILLVPSSKGDIWKQTPTEKTPLEHEIRHWSDVFTSQRMSKIASKPQHLGERHGTGSPS